jgi:phosphatidylglycerophosphate synthase
MNAFMDTLWKIKAVIPGVVLFMLFVLGTLVFAVRVLRHGYPELPESKRKKTLLASRFFMQYIFWLVAPFERGLANLRVSPAAISFASLAVCAGAGVAAGTAHFALGCWLYALSGVLDTLDGRVARRTGRVTKAGAFLDSVLDRWAEFLLLGGLLIGAHSVFARASLMVCIAGSQMVSYTRARGEGLGLVLDGGLMQRAERLVLVCLTMLVAAVGRESGWYDGWLVLSWGVLAVGLVSMGSAIRRFRVGVQELHKMEAAARAAASGAPAPTVVPTRPERADTRPKATPTPRRAT